MLRAAWRRRARASQTRPDAHTTRLLLTSLHAPIDTNVVSELMRPEPMSAVVAWFARHNAQEMYLAAVSEAELRYGLAIMPAGRRRNALKSAMVRWLDQGFADRILPFDSAAAQAYAGIAAFRRHAGRPISAADCQIAAISLTRDAVLVTRNVRNFERTGVEVVDPWATG